ncbi:MAG: 16S rRNA (cytosine(1402)-N(4))-methyltransferase RsmH [Deltaproteobacteria bacterium]|nr:16S rRNA (cytosine(1402)-N(4))-methyltransferase RsmH [Deltaproteobacteria bacterium]
MTSSHAPVMPAEVMDLLRPEAGKRYLDGTLGGGGHAEQILERSGPDGQVLGLDLDGDAIVAARQRLARFGERLVVREGNFARAGEILAELEWGRVNGILLDLGYSSLQVDSPERGFGFQRDARLDMRMNRRQDLDAYQIVNGYPAAELGRLIRDYGEERFARPIAAAIARERERAPIATTQQLAEVVARTVSKRKGRSGRRGETIHPATRVFQALRIAVNHELENLDVFLDRAYELLLSHGRMVIISFHSLEDRAVKRAFGKWSRSCLCPPRSPVCRCGWSRKVSVLTRKPLVPTPAEIRVNPRARSAKLRAVEGV